MTAPKAVQTAPGTRHNLCRMTQELSKAGRYLSPPSRKTGPAGGRGADHARARQFKLVFYITLLLIVYGSLYPFDFDFSSFPAAGAGALLSERGWLARGGDVLGNIALFLPFGATGMLAQSPGRSPRARFVLLCLIGFFVAAGVQLLQIFLPSRDPAVSDVFWNICGWSLGAALVAPAAVRARLLAPAGGSIAAVPAFLLLCWLTSELAPFVPSIDLQAYKDSLKPLFTVPDPLSVEFLRSCVAWLVVLDLLARVWPGQARSPWILAAALATVPAKIVIVQNSAGADYVLGLLLALSIWYGLLQRSARRVPFLVVALAVTFLITSLSPFTLRDSPQAFSWLPLSGALSGSMLVNVKAIAGKLFLLGALLYLLDILGTRRGTAVALVVLFSASMEVLQIWIGDHTPVITDPLLALLLGAALALSDHGPQPARRGAAPSARAEASLRRPEATPAIEATPTGTPPQGQRAPRRAGAAALYPARHAVIIALAGCLLMTFAVLAVLGLPKVPYNVKEIFGGEDAWWRAFLFSLAAVSVGAGGAYVGRVVAESGRAVSLLPGGTLAACLVTYLLLVSSVSAESLWDITGSANTYWFVMNQHMWGDFGVWLYDMIGSRALIQAVERFVRFTALFGQAVLWIAILSCVYFRVTASAERGAAARLRLAFSIGLFCLLAAAPWLVLFNLVAFDYSSTDNLNELIDGHGHVLYFLLILLPADALVAVHALRRPGPARSLVAVALLAASLPLGWLLLKHGLSPTVGKYGNTFSGVDFLLGPDRKDLLPESTLMLRWFALHCAAVATLVLGMQVVPALAGKKR